jgi:MFS transporter, NNP family, nitrate/nitrite transporter
MILFAKEPPDVEHQSLAGHLKCLWELDGWVFNMIYIITFGGFLGLATFLPSFYYSQFHVTKVQAGSLTVLATLNRKLDPRAWVVGCRTNRRTVDTRHCLCRSRSPGSSG